jgi:hypothetical protein
MKWKQQIQIKDISIFELLPIIWITIISFEDCNHVFLQTTSFKFVRKKL